MCILLSVAFTIFVCSLCNASFDHKGLFKITLINHTDKVVRHSVFTQIASFVLESDLNVRCKIAKCRFLFFYFFAEIPVGLHLPQSTCVSVRL